MAKSTKVANYSDAAIATLREGYTGSDNKAEVAALAAELGKSPASVRAKLSSMGIYVAAAKPKSTRKGDTKITIAEAIAELTSLSDAETEGLAKANKSALEKVLAKLTN